MPHIFDAGRTQVGYADLLLTLGEHFDIHCFQCCLNPCVQELVRRSSQLRQFLPFSSQASLQPTVDLLRLLNITFDLLFIWLVAHSTHLYSKGKW